MDCDTDQQSERSSTVSSSSTSCFTDNAYMSSSDISVPEYSRIEDSNSFEQSHPSPVSSSNPASLSQNDNCEFALQCHESASCFSHDHASEPSSSQGQESALSFSQSQHSLSQEQVQCTSSEYPTFKIVGDNIDKTVKPRFMRSDCQSKQLHYFHHYAVRDRVDMSTLSDEPPSPPASPESLPESLLPSEADNQVLAENFAIHISRILTPHLAFFKDSHSTITRHIPHDYSKEMAQKSTVVST